MPMNEEVRKAVDIDYAPGELDRTAPDRIWLQIDTSGMNSERDDPWPGDDGVSWCSEPIGGLEIQYIRADLLRAELTRLTAIADSVDPLVVRLGEVTTENERLRKIEDERWSVVATRNAAVMRAEKAEALLRECRLMLPAHCESLEAAITAHLSEPRT